VPSIKINNIIPKDVFEKVSAIREERINAIPGSDGNIRKPSRFSMKKVMANTENASNSV